MEIVGIYAFAAGQALQQPPAMMTAITQII
jgi:hypothetical protein